MKKYNRIFLIVTDSLGIGADARAKNFQDQGANTLLCAAKTGLLNIPNWKKLGIGCIADIDDVTSKNIKPTAYVTKAQEKSNAKDTLAGHWEIMGIKTSQPFPIFTETGFPSELIKVLENKWGRKIIGNKAASGTDIINELASQEINDQKIIVYTSGDSVLQICGHEKYTGLDNLYKFGKIARQICSSKPEWNVGRIIVRPYIEKNGKYERTPNRHDYAVSPPGPTILDHLIAKGIKVVGIGKIPDIFNHQGISQEIKSQSDENGLDITIGLAKGSTNNELIFLNLVDFDSKYGHRRDPQGYANNINLLDLKLGELIEVLRDDDLLIITSDHGTDPCFRGSDHTSEFIPVTIYAKNLKHPKVLKDFEGLATIGNLVAKNFDVKLSTEGEDRSQEII